MSGVLWIGAIAMVIVVGFKLGFIFMLLLFLYSDCHAVNHRILSAGKKLTRSEKILEVMMVVE